MSTRNAPRPAAVYGVDIGKNVFHVVGLDSGGEPVQRARFRRDTLLQFFERAAPAIVRMESCAGSQWIARRPQALGHKVRLIPAQFVKPYVKSNKSDIIDAEAIAEAATRPTMRFAAIKSEEQADLQALHRVRDQMIGTRTSSDQPDEGILPGVRHCIEARSGPVQARLAAGSRRCVERPLPGDAQTSRDLFADLRRLEQRIDQVTKEIAAIADREDVARRLMTIPGIGTLGATALLAAVGNGRQFQKARDLAAWLGLVPREHSTGGKQKLLGISKRGNRYVRKLLVHGARSCFRHLDRTRDRLGSWLDGLQSRMHPNKAVVALAAKMARIVWVVLTKPGALYERRDPAFA
jgi:transposase